MVEWQGVLNVTLENFLREVEEDVFRDFKLVAMLMKKGNIKYGQSGNDLKWHVRYRQAPLIGIADSDTITFGARTATRSPSSIGAATPCPMPSRSRNVR